MITASNRPASSFTKRLLPWLLGLLMLGVYGLTLNHWVAPASIGAVSRLQGLTWTPSLSEPVTFLLTYPFGWLPPARVPLAVNLLTAVCAGWSLAWLARSVVLLPQATVKEGAQWQMTFKPPQRLVSRAAWLPPLLAVLVCGLQLSFWQNAIATTGEMFNLLLFAYVIRCLLEFNACGKDSWLLRGAFAYGLAVANDGTMTVFCPAFLLALIWVKRIFIFNEYFLKQLFQQPRSFKLRLLWQIPGCWLAGLSLLLLLPALASHSPAAQVDFWPIVKHALHADKALLAQYPRSLLLISGLLFVLPFLSGARLGQFSASQNRLEFLIGPVFFESVRGFFLLVCLWMMFDSPLSPRHLAPNLASLPLYFLGALCIGGLAGHFLMISESQPAPPSPRQRHYSPLERREQQIRWLTWQVKRAVLPGLGLLAIGIPAALAGKNLPLIARKRADACGDYIIRIEQALPPPGAVIVGTDSFRLIYLQSALIRSGRRTDYLCLDAEALAQPGYWDFLRRTNPGFNQDLQAAQPAATDDSDAMVLHLLQALSQTRAIYFLPPAPLVNQLGEFFYAQPLGLLDQLKPYGLNSEFSEPAPPEIMRENATFWRAFETRQLPGLARRISPPQPPTNQSLSQRFLNTLRFWPEADVESMLAGTYYAVALNDWGVELQKARKFAEASPCFAGALQLSPLYAAAQINNQFNTNYLAKGAEMMQSAGETAARMNDYGGWQNVLREGAVDEPNFCFLLGTIAAENQLFRPALAQFDRVQQLVPTRVDACASLTRLFIQRGDYVNALTAVNRLLAIAPDSPEGLTLLAGVHMRTQAYLAAIPCLTRLLVLEPTNTMARLNLGRAYRNTGQFAAARQDYAELIESVTNAASAFPAYFDLAEMADQETNYPTAITNYELFLQYAPTNLAEIAEAKKRLQGLQSNH